MYKVYILKNYLLQEPKEYFGKPVEVLKRHKKTPMNQEPKSIRKKRLR